MKQRIYDLIISMPWPIQKCLIDISDFVKAPKLCVENRKKIKQLFREYTDISEIDDNKLSDENKKIWESALLYYAISSPRAARKIADNFCKCRLSCLKEEKKTKGESPVFICVVKDDLDRIKMSYEHHRSIGIKNFVFIDNGSTDGTLEWLMQQEVTIYQTLDPFIMWAKVAWISKVINYYGFDRWYLIVDSDELFVYSDCEKRTIEEYISQLEKKGIRRDFSFMLDMYAKGELFEEKNDRNSIRETYCYFDKDSYKKEYCLHYEKVIGGPRQRIFAKKNSMEMLQNKYPLVFMRKGDIYRYHYMAPYRDNFPAQCTSVLLHYKFLGGEYERYVKIAQDGNYAGGSRLYKDIIETLKEQGRVSFYNENSAKYRNSQDILKNILVDDWKKNL